MNTQPFLLSNNKKNLKKNILKIIVDIKKLW